MDLQRCQAIIVKEPLWPDLLEFHLKKNKALYFWYASKHLPATEEPSPCHHICGPHYHLILWWSDSRWFTELPLMSFLRRAEKRTSDRGKLYAHQRVRVLKSMLLYMQNPPREPLCIGDQNTPESILQTISNLPTKAKEAMANYVEERDTKHSVTVKDASGSSSRTSVRKVDLSQVIEFIREDGCMNYNDWQKTLFKFHPHGSMQRKALIQIVSHPQSDKLIRAADEYMMNDVLSMNFAQSLKYKTKILMNRINEGKDYNVEDSIYWLKIILSNNGISFSDFVDDVLMIMNRKDQKRNTLFLHGESNAGKSKIARSIINGCVTYGQVTRSETFLFMDCVDKQVILQEEVRITLETVDNFKLVFEGSPLKVDIKNKNSRELQRTPVIACSNTVPWYWIATEELPLKNRMCFYTLKQCDALKNMTKEITPLVWEHFIELLQNNDVTNEVDYSEVEIVIPETPEVGSPSQLPDPVSPRKKRKRSLASDDFIPSESHPQESQEQEWTEGEDGFSPKRGPRTPPGSPIIVSSGEHLYSPSSSFEQQAARMAEAAESENRLVCDICGLENYAQHPECDEIRECKKCEEKYKPHI